MGMGAAFAALLSCAVAQASRAADSGKITDPDAFLMQTESLRIKDHRQFTERLEQIHRESPPLTAPQRWLLRYLDALEASLEGDYTAAEKPLRDVIDRSRDPVLATKARALLMNNLAISHRYQDAFTLAHQLTADLPRIHDREARFLVLSYLSQTLNLAGQADLAIKYAHLLEETIPAGSSVCNPRFKLMAALYSAKRLTSSSPALRQTVDLCEKAGQPILVVATQLIISTLYLEEHKPAMALALLDRIASRIRINHYYPHTLSAQVQRAQAEEQLGNDDDARKAALAAVAMARPDDIDTFLRDAYQVLYRVTRRRGDSASALSYYEHYVAQDHGYLNDISAQALAYQAVQQQVLTRKLETEALSRQNSILKLQQALDAKAAETSRIYIMALLVALACIALWLFRLKRSQLRFKRLSSHDSLTGILNHQHFFSQADRTLRLLEKKLISTCLVSIDLDHFKQVNDTHGHAMGDAVLRHVVAVCIGQLRTTDLFGRLGGEEFGILLPDCSRSQGKEIANRIRLAIAAAAVEKDGAVVSISASVGLACTGTSGYELQHLCKEADVALYRAKRGGRNRVIANREGGDFVDA